MIPSDEPSWFEDDVVIAIHGRQLAEHGGSEGIRDRSMLDSALAKPQQLWAYANPDLYDLAAAYAFGLSKNHPFVDGNKRIAAVICETLLDLYGREVKLSEAEKYVEYYALAAGEHTEESFATWLRENSGPLKD
ncbi:type II toxin-antitoxin system death-on-curing family toxin [bacterium]|jgi:death on curing protein|nr:type II toxin-antitoxin system death-on-curing family toxin [Verrucomicrobiota bacterium]MDA7633299.1 type II toxin-antitoxin system death-on-curing family toxin [bacterium]MDA7867335.1 type II toxin-antitoxin system death-on-curing family toxin [Verrucomicrobiota bacterium]MDB4798634.1 type II toxin-antitoxin system death-on-curing family toxin [Verrucomicrobiota bacterium]